MKNLLVIKTSHRKESVSSMLAQEFSDALKAGVPGLKVDQLDLSRENLPNLDDAGMEAVRGSGEDLTAEQQAIRDRSGALIGRVNSADLVVIAAPMNNFTITANLRTLIDYLASPGRTFGYGEDGPKGLMPDKPVYVISSRGGDYGDGSPDNPNPFDFQSGYIRHILGFLGITSVEIIAANAMDRNPELREAGLTAARERIASTVAKLAGK